MPNGKIIPWTAIISVAVIATTGVGTASVVSYQIKQAMVMGIRLESRIEGIETTISRIDKALASKEYLETRVEKLEERIHELETRR